MKAIDRRLATLEARTAGADVVGIWYQPESWNPEHNDGLVRVCGSDERLTQEAFADRYPSGTLVRVIYIDDWKEDGMS